MKIQQFLKLAEELEPTNYLVLCSNNLGLNNLLHKTLTKVSRAEDVYFYDAATITKEKARQMERDARLAPRGSSAFNNFYLYNLQNLPRQSVGPLLKVVEESKYTRFIFQAQYLPGKIRTLMSRAIVINLSFMSKAIVLANIKAMNLDARAVETLNLWDGTLGGTVVALQMKDTLIGIRREMKKGQRGLTALMTPDMLNSLAFPIAAEDFLNEQEKLFLKREDTLDRRKLTMILAAERVP